jgi:hypothetical protein
MDRRRNGPAVEKEKEGGEVGRGVGREDVLFVCFFSKPFQIFFKPFLKSNLFTKFSNFFTNIFKTFSQLF